MPNALARFLRRYSPFLLHIALLLLLALALGMASLVLALRYWVMPDIERYHSEIAGFAARALGAPVAVQKIEADWSGIHPRLHLTQVRVLDPQGEAALQLQQVDAVVAWRSMLYGELRLRSLSLVQPELTVRRDAQGGWHVAGFQLQTGGGDGTRGDWLLRQMHVEVQDARVTWLDEAQGKEALPFEQVSMVLENGRRSHRFAMRAVPPAFLSAPLELRGSLLGSSFADLGGWRGEIEAKLIQFDAMAWAYWFPLPEEFARTRGDVNLKVNLERGGRRKLTADVAVQEIQARLMPELPLLEVRKLQGRLVWHELEHGFEAAGKGVTFELGDGFVLPPTDLVFRREPASGNFQGATEIGVSRIELSNLPYLSSYFPLEPALRQQLIEAAPQGRVDDLVLSWQGKAPADSKRYKLRARLDGVSVMRTGKLPGFSGLSGKIDAGENGGTLALEANGLRLDAPEYLLEPLAFDVFQVQANWRRLAEGWEVELNQAQLANADLAGTVYGSYRGDKSGLGSADISVNLTRAAVKQTAKYIPRHLMDETQDWLKAGLLAGEADDFRLRLRGDLDEFPFPENRGGLFQIKARAHGVGIDYAPGWPRIEQAKADLLIEGRRLEVSSNEAYLAGGLVQKAVVSMPDMLADRLRLQVQGEASGPTRHPLNYINRSPLRETLKGFTADIKAAGNGKLTLYLDIPLSGPEAIKVQGRYRFDGNELDLGPDIPDLHQVNGELVFSESGMSARNVLAEVYGGPAQLAMHTDPDGRLNVQAEGRLEMEALSRAIRLPVLKHCYGAANWKSTVSALDDDVVVQVSSDLAGLGADLPPPFAKRRHENVPLRFEMKNLTVRRDQVTVQYGKQIRATLLRELERGQWLVKRGSVNLGPAAARQNERPGIWVAGTLPALALDEWIEVGILDWGDGAAGSLPGLDGIDLAVGKLTGYGNAFNELRITGQRRERAFLAHLAAKELNGELEWQPQGAGKLLLRLKEGALGGFEGRSEAKPATQTSGMEEAAAPVKLNIPVIDVSVERFSFQRKPLGKLELHVSQNGQDILLDHLRMSNPDGALSANGKWDLASRQTHLNFKLDLYDAGKVLGRSGFPGMMKDGNGSLSSDLLWSGGPHEFELSSLDGHLGVKTGKGQFLKVNPGAGKLLSVLNLQALPKRVALDFTDVFSSGFEFDSIEGEAQIKQGVLVTKDFRINGSAANVLMSGQVDLMRETQNLRVRISPKLSDSVSLLAFAGGPVVGTGVLIASKLLRDPLDKLVSFEYNVAGNWVDPKVEKVSSAPSQPPRPLEKKKE